jgi:hypothetical protein
MVIDPKGAPFVSFYHLLSMHIDDNPGELRMRKQFDAISVCRWFGIRPIG